MAPRTRSQRVALTLAFLLGFGSACKGQTAVPAIPAIPVAHTVIQRMTAVLYITQLTPAQVPPQYRGWYADAERCSGLRGSYDRVRWYTSPHPWSDKPGAITYAMNMSRHRIVINAENALDSAMVVHESLHDILNYQRLYEQNEPHPAAWFGDKPGKCSYHYYPGFPK